MADKIRNTKKNFFRKFVLSHYLKIEKSIPWIIIFSFISMIFLGMGIVAKEALANNFNYKVVVPGANFAPTVGTVTLNGGSNITVVENSSAIIAGYASVSDANGYSDIASVTSTLYLNNTTSCNSANVQPMWCYFMPVGSASGTCVTSSCSVNSCQVECSTYVWFIAEPTTPTSTYPATATWVMEVRAKDESASTSISSTSQGLNTLYALNLDSSINYGNLNPNSTSSQQTINCTNTGNYIIDAAVSGNNMNDGASHSIVSTQQRFGTTSGFGWATGTILNNLSIVFKSLNLAAAKSTTTGSMQPIYWLIQIPVATYANTYSGTNTITPVDNQ